MKVLVQLAGRLSWLTIVLLGACSSPAETHSKLTVLASIRPLALMIEQMAGDVVDVQTLLPPNADPHNMALRISDRQRVEAAELVVWLGPDFERFLSGALKSRAAQAQLNLSALDGLHWPASSHDHYTESHGRDMHLWLDPDNAAVVMRAVQTRLLQLRPDLSDALEQGLQRALAKLKATQQRVQQQLQPHTSQGFGVDHDAYGHFVHAFDLHQLAAVSEVSGQSMSAKQRYQLRQQLEGAQCLLVERITPVNERLAKAFNLPIVVADALAGDQQLKDYSQFLDQLAQAFAQCLSGPAQ